MTTDEQFELVCWLIERYDNMRSLVSNRAAIIVSADALLLAGATFLFDKLISVGSRIGPPEKTILLLVVSAMVVFLSLSLLSATRAIAFTWATGRKATRSANEPNILFFHATGTTEALPTSELFAAKFKSTTKEQMNDYALTELLLITRIHEVRYKSLRWALRFLQLAIPPFLIAILIVLATLL